MTSQQELIESLQQLLQEKEELLQSKESHIQSLQNKVQTLQQQLHTALHARFGRKSEKASDVRQLSLCFDEAAVETLEVEPLRAADESIHIPAHTRKKTGRKPLPKELPRVQQFHDLSQDEKICKCGCALTCIGEEKSEQLDFIPAKVYVIENIRKKYACKQCEETIKTAAMPKQPIPKSIATPGLLAHIAVSKIDDHLPLYRQEEILQRYGIDIARNTLGDWMIRCGTLIEPLITLFRQTINDYDVAFADETQLQVLKQPEKTATQQSYMWLFIGGPPDKRCILYHYDPSRGQQVPLSVLAHYQGYLHIDGYQGYLPLIATRRVKAVACLAHIRRKFVEITRTVKIPGLAHQAVTSIAQLYAIEKQLKLDKANADVILQTRQEKSKSILTTFQSWLEKYFPTVPPQSAIGKAMAYALKQLPYLGHYLNDGRLEIDNNRSERAIKPFVIGRKNWLFAGNRKGAVASANLFSLIETAKEHGLEPYAYLSHVFTHIPNADTLEKMSALLPYHYKCRLTAAEIK